MVKAGTLPDDKFGQVVSLSDKFVLVDKDDVGVDVIRQDPTKTDLDRLDRKVFDEKRKKKKQLKQKKN